MGGPCGLRVGVTPKNKIFSTNPTLRATFVYWPPLNSQSKYPHLLGWTLRARGWGEPPQIKFYMSNPPRGATFVCWPLPNSLNIHPHLVGWTLRAPGLGEPPTNKILHGKPTPRSNFCLLAPTQFFTLQGFSDGVTVGGTPGVNIWVRPLARCRARVKWGAHAKFWGDGLCGSGGRPPDTHTHTHTYTHTHFHLYIVDSRFHVLCEHIAYQITCTAVNFAITFNGLFHNLAI